MSFRAHLGELRTSLLAVAAVFLVFSMLGYTYRDKVLSALLAPLGDQKLSYLTPGGGFSFIFAVTMWCGVVAALPVLLSALYKFIVPAFPEEMRRRPIGVFLTSSILLVCGALFGYFVAIPAAIQFLLGFADEYVQAMLTTDSYLSFVVVYTVGLGVLFQIPLVIAIANWVRPLKLKRFIGALRYVILGAFIIAAVLTPTPDVVNQCIMALPIIVMYLAGLGYVAWEQYYQRRKGISST